MPNFLVTSVKLVLFLHNVKVILAVASLMRQDQQISAILDVLPEIVCLGGREAVLGGSDDQKMRLFNLLEIYGILVESNLRLKMWYLIHLLVFLHKFLEV